MACRHGPGPATMHSTFGMRPLLPTLRAAALHRGLRAVPKPRLKAATAAVPSEAAAAAGGRRAPEEQEEGELLDSVTDELDEEVFETEQGTVSTVDEEEAEVGPARHGQSDQSDACLPPLAPGLPSLHLLPGHRSTCLVRAPWATSTLPTPTPPAPSPPATTWATCWACTAWKTSSRCPTPS